MADPDFQTAPTVQDLVAPPRRGMVAPPATTGPQPSGPTGLAGYAAAPIAGAFETAGQLASAVQAGAQVVGATDVAQKAKDFAARQAATAATYTSPDLANQPWYSPSGLAFNVLKGVPVVAGMLGAGLLTGGAADAGLLGAAAARAGAGMIGGITAGVAGYPLAVGGGVQTAEAQAPGGKLSTGQAIKAAALGVPEAAVGAIPFGSALARGAEGSLLHAATQQAITQAAAGAAQDAIAQQMNNRSIPFRMDELLQSAITGGATGAILGGGLHAISKANPADVTPEQMGAIVDQATAPKQLPPPAVAAGPPLDTIPAEDLITRARGGDTAAMQEMQRRAGPPAPPPGPEPGEAIIPQPDQEHIDLANAHVADQPAAAPGLTPDEMEALPNVTHAGAPATEPTPPAPDLAAIQAAHPPEVIPQPEVLDQGEPIPHATGPAIEELPGFHTSEPYAPEPHPLQNASPEELKAAAGKQLSKAAWLKDSLTDYDTAKAAIADKIGPRDDESPPIPATLQKLGETFGVVDAAGRPIVDEQNAPNRPPIEAIGEAHQARWQAAEALRDDPAVKADPEAVRMLDEAQIMMADPRRGDTAKIDKLINTVEGSTEVEAAKDALIPDRAPRAAPPTPPAPAAEPPPPRDVVAKVQALNAAKPPLDTTPAAAGAPPREVPTTPKLTAALDKAQSSLDTLKDIVPSSNERMNGIWKSSLKSQQAKLDAIKNGTPVDRALLPDEHFANNPLWDSYYDRLKPDAQKALTQHVNNEEAVMGEVRRTSQLRDPFARPTEVPANSPRTSDDVANTGLIQGGASARDVLERMRTNDTDSTNRTIAGWLLRHNADPDIQFSNPDTAPQGIANLREGEHPAAMFDPDGNRIHLYQSDETSQNVLHEFAHAASYDALEAGGPAASRFNAIHSEAQARFLSDNPEATKDTLPNFLRDPHELLAETFSNPAVRDWLAGQREAASDRTLWQSIKSAIKDLLGFKGGQRTMLDQVLEGGKKVMAANDTMRSIRTPEGSEARLQPMFRTLDGFQKRTFGLFDKEARTGKMLNISNGARKTALGWFTAGHIGEWYGKFSEGIKNYVERSDRRNLLTEINNKVSHNAVTKLQALSPDGLKRVNDMARGTFVGLDGRKPWTEADSTRFGERSTSMLQRHNELTRTWGKMLPIEKDAYNTAIAVNRGQIHQQMATHLYNMLKGDYSDKVALPPDPSYAHQMANALHESPVANEAYWSKAYDDMAKVAQGHIDEQAKAGEPLKVVKNDKTALDETRAAANNKLNELQDSVAPLKSLMSDRDARVREMDAVPNFKMGHGDGDYFVSGKFEGLKNAAMVDRFQTALNKAGFGHIALDHNLENNTIYSRVSSQGEQEQLLKVFQSMHDHGMLEKGSVASGLTEQVLAKGGTMPLWQERMLNTMRAGLRGLGDGVDEKTKALVEQRIGETTRDFMAMLPDSSINKIMAHREGVQGYTDDVLANFRQRAGQMNRGLANATETPNIAAATVQMAHDIRALNSTNDPARIAAAMAAGELRLREAQTVGAQPNSWIGKMRGLTHTIEIGTSPAYVLTLLSQVGTLTLPELGSREGYLRSAQALARQTSTAFNIMRTALGGEQGAQFGLRESEMLKAGIAPGVVAKMMDLQNRGGLAHATYTTAMRGGEHESDTYLGKVANYANTLGLYAEMFPRVLTALAAHDLHESRPGQRVVDGAKVDASQFAHQMVMKSQFNWDPSFNPRAVGNKGAFGPMSPLINQFMGYQIRFTEKMFRETANAFGRGGPEETARARMFLAGHLAAMTTIAGTLGAPMAGVMASVFDRLADWATGKDDWDVTAAYRRFLTAQFGSTAGEVIAKGVPRAFGLDMSHLGDEKMLPGSTAALYLTEKRKMEDAEKDWLKAEAGSAAGIIANAVFGIRDLANGDYLRGAQKLVPELLRGPVEAAQMAKYGYVDKSGMRLPITASAGDILKTAMGLDPEDEAQYAEKKKVASGEMNLAQLRSGNIMQHLSQAYARGDHENFQYWQNQSAEFSHDHPGQLPPIAEFGRYLQEHMRNAAIARMSGTPIGVTPRNLTARGMVNF